MGCRVLLDDLEKSGAVAAGLVGAEAADADGGAFGDAGDELDGLTAGGIGEKLALVAVEKLFAFSCFFGIEFKNLRDELASGARVGSQTSK